MKVINMIVLMILVCAPNSFAAWERIGGIEAGAIGSNGSPTVQFTYEYTVTVENTIDPLLLDSYGGCITWIYLDFLDTDPDSITTTLNNVVTDTLSFPVTGPSTGALTDDGVLYQPDTGSPLCIAKNFSYTFTGTVAVGDKFRIITEAMVSK